MQSKVGSFVESLCNNGSAFLISLLLWEYVIGPLYDDKVLTQSWQIVVMFTVVSIVRSYLWRRLFNVFSAKVRSGY